MLILLKKFIKNDTVLLITAILLFFVGYYIQDYYFPISNSRYRIILYRNFIFLGFPFIFIGYYIKKYKERLLKIPTSILATIVVISIVVLLLESNFYFIHNSRKDFLISILFLAPSLFVLISKISRYAVNDGYIGSLASGIFYTHILSIYIVNSVFPASELKILLLPFIIFLSMILSAVIIRLNKQINIFF